MHSYIHEMLQLVVVGNIHMDFKNMNK